VAKIESPLHSPVIHS